MAACVFFFWKKRGLIYAWYSSVARLEEYIYFDNGTTPQLAQYPREIWPTYFWRIRIWKLCTMSRYASVPKEVDRRLSNCNLKLQLWCLMEHYLHHHYIHRLRFQNVLLLLIRDLALPTWFRSWRIKYYGVVYAGIDTSDADNLDYWLVYGKM